MFLEKGFTGGIEEVTCAVTEDYKSRRVRNQSVIHVAGVETAR